MIVHIADSLVHSNFINLGGRKLFRLLENFHALQSCIIHDINTENLSIANKNNIEMFKNFRKAKQMLER